MPNESEYRECDTPYASYASDASSAIFPPADTTSRLTVSTSTSDTTYTNHLCLDFHDRGDSPSQKAKCRSFWHHVGSTPGLGAVMARGRGWEGPREATPPAPPPAPPRPWLHQLLKLEATGLGVGAVGGGRTHPRGEGPSVLAHAIEQSATQTMEDIAVFEAELDRREAERDPNQTVLGYRNKQPPPRIPN